MTPREHATDNFPLARPDGTARPLRLRPVDREQASLARHVGDGLGATLSTDAGSLRLEVSGPRAIGRAASVRPLTLSTPAGPLWLAPAREIVRTLSAIDVPDDDPLQALRLDIASRAMPDGWFSLFDASAVLAPGGEPAAEGAELTLTLFQPDARLGLSATLRGSVAALLHALSQPGWQRLRDDSPFAAPDLPLSVPLLLGRAVLSMGEVDDLREGDVVPFTHGAFDVSGEGELRIANGVARVVLDLGNRPQVQLTEWHPNSGGTPMDDALDSDDGGTGADGALDDLPVTLRFELGALKLSLAEVRDLGPGCVLPLSDAATPHVSILAGDRHLGSGELVELDGQLAVEIRRLRSAP